MESKENKQNPKNSGQIPEQLEKQVPEEVKKEIVKIQENLKGFKKAIIKKFPFIEAIGIIPPQASKLIEDEEEVKKEKPEEKLIHVSILVPEEKIKKIPELKIEAVKLIQGLKPRVWLHIKSTKEIWEMCFDGKYALMEAISMSFPLHDKGILGALRVASIHKTLTLKKFERYVVSYVLAGSIVTGGATKTSDVDVYIIIDDTDVKRMSRYELREKLRAIIYSYAFEANNIAGAPNKLSPQIYIMTEFWEAVKDAHPVIFTFIRDGVPLYDKGAFMPWKLLLKMGKIKPSPEAIDMFMSLGDKVAKNVKRKLNDIVTEDIYWGVITPSQALIMLYGVAPPTPKETVPVMKDIFVKKEKLLEQKYIEILNKIVTLYKNYEHEKVKTISGKEIDELLKQSSAYIKRLKELMKQIEGKIAEREILQLNSSIFDLLKGIFGKAGEATLVKKFEKELIEKTKIAPRNLMLFKKIIEAKKKYAKGKITKQGLAEAHKSAHELTIALLEYLRRQELLEIEQRKIKLRYKVKENGKEIKKETNLILFKDVVYIVPHMAAEVIKKWQVGKLQDCSKGELKEKLAKKELSEKVEKKLTPELLLELKKMFGSFELIF